RFFLEVDLFRGSFSRVSNVVPPQFLHFGIFLPLVTCVFSRHFVQRKSPVSRAVSPAFAAMVLLPFWCFLSRLAVRTSASSAPSATRLLERSAYGIRSLRANS